MARFLLSKTSFTHYLECPIRLWLEKVRPDLLPPEDPALERLFEQGRIVDDLSRGLFTNGVAVQDYNESGYRNTKQAIAEGAKILYQPTAVADGLSARADILTKGKGGKWDIHEVKSATQVKPEYVSDLAFQRICFEAAGIPIGKTFLVHVDNTYVRHGAVEVDKLLAEEDLTEDVTSMIPEVGRRIPEAKEVLGWPRELEESQIATCVDPSKSDCVIFWLNSLNPVLRERVLRAANPFKIGKLLEKEVISPGGLTRGFLESVSYRTPEEHWPHKKDIERIKEEIGKLVYPLHFFDYETYSSAVPAFDGYRPYQQIPFQFSLAVQESPDSKPRIHDFLMETFEDPAPKLIAALRKYIGPKGSVISWYSVFEESRNEELALMHPEHADFLRGINERMFDLMQIFKQKLYVHPDFLGSASLKNVMPVLIPSLSYKDLHIQEGGEASASWLPITDPKLPKKQREQLIKDEIEYCRLDVHAMVKILEYLRTL